MFGNPATAVEPKDVMPRVQCSASVVCSPLTISA